MLLNNPNQKHNQELTANVRGRCRIKRIQSSHHPHLIYCFHHRHTFSKHFHSRCFEFFSLFFSCKWNPNLQVTCVILHRNPHWLMPQWPPVLPEGHKNLYTNNRKYSWREITCGQNKKMNINGQNVAIQSLICMRHPIKDKLSLINFTQTSGIHNQWKQAAWSWSQWRSILKCNATDGH